MKGILNHEKRRICKNRSFRGIGGLKDFVPRMRMNMVTSIVSLHKILGYNLLGFAWRTTGVLFV